MPYPNRSLKGNANPKGELKHNDGTYDTTRAFLKDVLKEANQNKRQQKLRYANADQINAE